LEKDRRMEYDNNNGNIVEHFYSDGIIKYDRSSMPQIEETISKETLYSSSQ
jgi:hypothetical protein